MRDFIITALLTAALVSSVGNDDYTLSNVHHTVRAGQTVWEIASFYMDRQDKISDVRELVWEIKERNNLASYIILPGQVLEIPIWRKNNDRRSN